MWYYISNKVYFDCWQDPFFPVIRQTQQHVPVSISFNSNEIDPTLSRDVFRGNQKPGSCHHFGAQLILIQRGPAVRPYELKHVYIHIYIYICVCANHCNYIYIYNYTYHDPSPSDFLTNWAIWCFGLNGIGGTSIWTWGRLAGSPSSWWAVPSSSLPNCHLDFQPSDIYRDGYVGK